MSDDSDLYLAALADVTAFVAGLQQGGPELPALCRGQVLAEFGRVRERIEQLRRRRVAAILQAMAEAATAENARQELLLGKEEHGCIRHDEPDLRQAPGG